MNTTEHHNPARSGVSAQVWDRPFYKGHKSWCDDFVMELRLMDVPGDVIGDRLAEVEAHCAESGETPDEAFGEPVAYAKTVGAESPKESAGGLWATAALSVGQVLALLVGTRAAGAWAAGESVAYNAVQVLCLALAAAVLVLLPVALRFLLQRPLLTGLPYFASFMALALGAVLAGELDLPALITAPAALVTVGLFVVTVVLGWVSYRDLSSSQDPVTSPLSAFGTATSAEGKAAGGSRGVALLMAVVFPVFYVLLSVVSWLTA
ncbi:MULTISPECIES: hypothetical protein [Kocuria]|uniref:Uncharacterized protein n=1 Tax=Kocuria subflava TaxID=1736139 RepID=A0A846TVU9_9MICC|nr:MULTISPECIES: hypothetical protein [Kocuria]NKE09357.1 hypothetical protein [Kocuria subflava]